MVTRYTIMKRVISKKTIKVGKKYYTEEKYWAMFPSDRIITTRTRRIMIPLWKKIQKVLYMIRELILIIFISFISSIMLIMLLFLIIFMYIQHFLENIFKWTRKLWRK